MKVRMKIKIVDCRDSRLWYADKVGQILNVEKTNASTGEYWCREGGPWNCLNVVYEQDAELVEGTYEVS